MALSVTPMSGNDVEMEEDPDCGGDVTAQLARVWCCNVLEVNLDEEGEPEDAPVSRNEDGDRRRLPNGGCGGVRRRLQGTWYSTGYGFGYGCHTVAAAEVDLGDPVIVLGVRFDDKAETYDEAAGVCKEGGIGWRLCAADELTSGQIWFQNQGGCSDESAYDIWVHGQCEPLSVGDRPVEYEAVGMNNGEDFGAYTESAEASNSAESMLLGAGIGAIVIAVLITLIVRCRIAAKGQESDTDKVADVPNAVHIADGSDEVANVDGPTGDAVTVSVD